jgi:NAD(P)-dependent dehydrogenase (short-subunit alcohol dehydrogenase family)
MINNKNWFVTGASKGLGLILVKKLLAEGYQVAATSRNIDSLTQAVGEKSPHFLPLAVDLSSEESVQSAIAQTVEHFGRIDVIVNNAGYGQVGALEEFTANFEVNVFGTFNVIKNALPYLRKQQSGHIFNISSIGGLTGSFPGFGAYCGTKFAVNGLSESLAEEVKAFGIKVTIVEPGYFRTEFLNGSSLSIAQNPIEAYQDVRASESFHQSIDGKQPGDPQKAAIVMINISKEENPPLNLLLGTDAVAVALEKIERLKAEVLRWESVSASTNFEV